MFVLHFLLILFLTSEEKLSVSSGRYFFKNGWNWKQKRKLRAQLTDRGNRCRSLCRKEPEAQLRVVHMCSAVLVVMRCRTRCPVPTGKAALIHRSPWPRLRSQGSVQCRRSGAACKQWYLTEETGEGVLAHSCCVLVVGLCKGIAEGGQQAAQIQRMKRADRLISLDTLKIQEPICIMGGAGKVCTYQAGKWTLFSWRKLEIVNFSTGRMAPAPFVHWQLQSRFSAVVVLSSTAPKPAEPQPGSSARDRSVIAVGGSLLGGRRSPICQRELPSREVSCLPRSGIQGAVTSDCTALPRGHQWLCQRSHWWECSANSYKQERNDLGCEGQGSLGCSEPEMVEFRILRGRSKGNSKNATMDFRRADFGLSRDLLGSITGHMALERRDIQESLLIFKDCVPKAQQ